MSHYKLPGKEDRYTITIGWDNTLPVVEGSPPGTLFAQVEDTGWASGLPGGNEADVEVGDTPEGGLLVWVGQGVDDLISDVQTIVKAVAPYGDIPLATQVALLRDMDRDWPRPPHTVGQDLAAVCRQSPSARLPSVPERGKSHYILIDEHGWQLRDWESSFAQGWDYGRTFTDMIVGSSESDRVQYGDADPLASYLSDPSIIIRLHPMGLKLGLPVYTALDRGVMFAGPVVIAGEDHGLSERQVRLVKEEVLFVEESVRTGVASLWSHVWSTIETRLNVSQFGDGPQIAFLGP